MMQESQRMKLVVVGDGSVGKTSVLVSFAKNQFPREYEPTVFDNLSTVIRVDGTVINLGLWDTAGQEEYSTLRQLAYPNSDVFFIVFDIVNSASFANARKKWYPEVRQCVPDAIFIFLGNKCDLRAGKVPSREEFRRSVESEIHCEYYECSALTQEGLTEVFEAAARRVIEKKTGRKTAMTSPKPSKKVEREKEESFCGLI